MVDAILAKLTAISLEHPEAEYRIASSPFSPYGEEITNGHQAFEVYPLECTVREYVMRSSLLPPLTDEALSIQIQAKSLPPLARWALNYAALRSAEDIEPHVAIEEMRMRFEELGKVLRPQSYTKALDIAQETVKRAYGVVSWNDEDFSSVIQRIDMSGVEPRKRYKRAKH